MCSVIVNKKKTVLKIVNKNLKKKTTIQDMVLFVRLSDHISVLVKHLKYSRFTKIAYDLIVCYRTLNYIHRGYGVDIIL